MAEIKPPQVQAPMRSAQPTQTTNNNTSTVISSTSVGTNPATFLYDVGLQNIYQDYQKNISKLNQQEQQSLQDAYTIREMSKKYLGEYASNVGIGDVSGNLLDIYGQYQQMVATTRGVFQEKEETLQAKYESAKKELEAGRLTAGLVQPGGEDGTDIIDYGSQFLPGTTNPNPNYIPGFNAQNYYPDDVEVGPNSRVLSIGGAEYVSVNAAAGEEPEGSPYNNFSTADIDTWYAKKYDDPESPYYQKPAMTGAVIFFTENQTNYYKGQDGKWYRLKAGTGVQSSQTMEQGSSNFYIPSGQTSNSTSINGQLVVFSNPEPTNPLRPLDSLSVSYGGVEYTIPTTTEGGVQQIDNKFSFLANGKQNLNQEQQQILNEFHKLHNTSRTQRGKDLKRVEDLRDNSFVYFRGKFYAFKGGQIVELKRSVVAK